MFISRKNFFAIIKEKERKIDQNGKISYITYPVSMLNLKDVRTIEEGTKKQFNNTDIANLIAKPILLLKSFEYNRIYICSWHYKILRQEILKVIDGSEAESPLSAVLDDLAINFNGKIDIDNTDFLDAFAMHLKDELLLEVSYYNKK